MNKNALKFTISFFNCSPLFSVELDAKEREHRRTVEQMKIDHEKELFDLKQENYVLSAKVILEVYK